MNLLPQDVLVMLKLAVSPDPWWTYATIAHELGVSSSMAFSSVKRATQARLYNTHEKRPRRKALEEFLVHGVKYAFPPEVGAITRGIPTAFAASRFKEEFGPFGEDPEIYVWPHPTGEHRGMALSPLYKSVPEAVENDLALYDILAVLDAIRIGRAREQRHAEDLIREMLSHAPAAQPAH